MQQACLLRLPTLEKLAISVYSHKSRLLHFYYKFQVDTPAWDNTQYTSVTLPAVFCEF